MTRPDPIERLILDLNPDAGAWAPKRRSKAVDRTPGLPTIGKRTSLGMAKLYFRAALDEMMPDARLRLYRDLRRILDRLEAADRAQAARSHTRRRGQDPQRLHSLREL